MNSLLLIVMEELDIAALVLVFGIVLLKI